MHVCTRAEIEVRRETFGAVTPAELCNVWLLGMPKRVRGPVLPVNTRIFADGKSPPSPLDDELSVSRNFWLLLLIRPRLLLLIILLLVVVVSILQDDRPPRTTAVSGSTDGWCEWFNR